MFVSIQVCERAAVLYTYQYFQHELSTKFSVGDIDSQAIVWSVCSFKCQQEHRGGNSKGDDQQSVNTEGSHLFDSFLNGFRCERCRATP